MQRPPFSTFEKYASNPYPDAFPKALKRLKELSTDDSIWQKSGEREGVTLRQYASEGTGVPIFRGDGYIEGYSVEEILSAIHQPSSRAIWDERYEDAFPIEIYDRNLVAYWAAQKGSGYLVWPRDFTGILGHAQEKEGDQRVSYYVQTSVNMKNVPEFPASYVRGTLHVAGVILRPLDGTNRVEVTYIVNVDPAGYIPSSIVAMVAVEIPMCIARIRSYLQDHGFPPYIPRHTDTFPGTLQGDRFDHASGSTEIRWRPEGSRSFRVYYDKSKWIGGARVSPGEGTSEGDFQVKEGEGYIEIVCGDDVNGRNLVVTVKKV